MTRGPLHLFFLLATLTTPLTAFSADPKLPRYRFEPGCELSFRSSLVFHSGKGLNAAQLTARSDWTVWVLRANTDGSFRLVAREKNVMSQTRDGKTYGEPAETHIGYADVFSDGRLLMNKTILYQGNPGTLFPPLPPDAARAKASWESVQDDETITCKRLPAAGDFAFEVVRQSAMDKVYLSSSRSRYTFDVGKGLVTRSESEVAQGYGLNGKGAGVIELVAVKALEPTAAAVFAEDADRYFAALAAYEEKITAAGRLPPGEARTLLVDAAAGLKAAGTALEKKELRTALAAKLTEHREMENDYLQAARQRARFLHKPAPDLETTDMDGKTVTLANLRGKVVVLDFWYRGCGWCLKAMPQLNRLADDFAGQPVAIFGMNTDHNQADARFVIEKMGLNYPTLKAEGQQENFGVEGFPALIVIDQRGRVHDIHVGYSPTLREEVGKEVRDLLAGK
jgi:peroxiredoxin